MTHIFTSQFARYECEGVAIERQSGAVTLRARIERDLCMGSPWDEHDGHGSVSDWTRRAKRPGERVLCKSHGANRYYDFAGAVAKARAEGWNCSETIALQEAGQTFTPGEIAHRAVEHDFNVLRAWCNDEWTWCGVVVELVVDEAVIDVQSLWGIELNYPGGDNSHLNEVSEELADELIGRADTVFTGKIDQLQAARAELGALEAAQ